MADPSNCGASGLPEHCWHTILVLESLPEIYVQQCCVCGEERSTHLLFREVMPQPTHQGPLPAGSVACQGPG